MNTLRLGRVLLLHRGYCPWPWLLPFKVEPTRRNRSQVSGHLRVSVSHLGPAWILTCTHVTASNPDGRQCDCLRSCGLSLQFLINMSKTAWDEALRPP